MPRPAGHNLNEQAWEDLVASRGFTPTSVAERADIPRATISSLLGGHHAASVPMAHRIALAVGVHPATLFPSLNRRFDSVPVAKQAAA